MVEEMKINVRRETAPSRPEAKTASEQHHHGHEKAEGHEQRHKLERARHEASEYAVSAKDTLTAAEDKAHEPRHSFVNHELKVMAYERVLTRTRKQLSRSSRVMSKIIHQPVVSAVSETAGKTVARPSGFLGGGLLALAGTLIYYYLTMHYGYEYQYSAFLLFLAGGFVIGWLAEALYRLLRLTK